MFEAVEKFCEYAMTEVDLTKGDRHGREVGFVSGDQGQLPFAMAVP